MPCTGERFLIYTDYGGKVIEVLPTPERSKEDVQKMLADGVEVQIEGMSRDRVRIHTHAVPADRIHFLGSPSSPAVPSTR